MTERQTERERERERERKREREREEGRGRERREMYGLKQMRIKRRTWRAFFSN